MRLFWAAKKKIRHDLIKLFIRKQFVTAFSGATLRIKWNTPNCEFGSDESSAMSEWVWANRVDSRTSCIGPGCTFLWQRSKWNTAASPRRGIVEIFSLASPHDWVNKLLWLLEISILFWNSIYLSCTDDTRLLVGRENYFFLHVLF